MIAGAASLALVAPSGTYHVHRHHGNRQLMKYNVNLFAVVRVKVPGIKADTPAAAAQKAEAMVSGAILGNLFSHRGDGKPIERTEWAKDITSFMVDPLTEGGTVDYDKTIALDATDYQPDTSRHRLNKRELANVLVALRMLRNIISASPTALADMEYFKAKGVAPFTPAEIDQFCQRMNLQ